MLLLAAALTLSINIELDLSGLIRASRAAEPRPVCGITTVGYRFTGPPRQQFRYSGQTYLIPEEGYVELIADPRRTEYEFAGRRLPLEGPRNAFGFRDVELPVGR
ncbi:MAG TPA: hypothetical protein VGF28_27285 [Thermoanaerobaculia bacterium]|jgi:hypothetical protein